MMFTSSVTIFASAAALYLAQSAVAQTNGGAIWGGINITEAALTIRGAISSPTCNATEPCQAFVNQVIPLCLNLRGEAGCWCGNHNPLHYCALCMSNPSDNTTNPDQTQAATNGHGDYHRACGAFGAALNATGVTTSLSATETAVSSSSGSSSKSNTGTIAGAVVGGVVGLALIGGIIFLIHRRMKSKDQKAAYENSGASMYSEPKYGQVGPPSSVGSPPPQMTGPTPPPTFSPYAMPPHSPNYSQAGSAGYNVRDSAAPTEYDTSMFQHLETPQTHGYTRAAEPMS